MKTEIYPDVIMHHTDYPRILLFSDPTTRNEVSVTFETLEEVIANKYRSDLISSIEGMDAQQIMELKAIVNRKFKIN